MVISGHASQQIFSEQNFNDRRLRRNLVHIAATYVRHTLQQKYNARGSLLNIDQRQEGFWFTLSTRCVVLFPGPRPVFVASCQYILQTMKSWMNLAACMWQALSQWRVTIEKPKNPYLFVSKICAVMGSVFTGLLVIVRMTLRALKVHMHVHV